MEGFLVQRKGIVREVQQKAITEVTLSVDYPSATKKEEKKWEEKKKKKLELNVSIKASLNCLGC